MSRMRYVAGGAVICLMVASCGNSAPSITTGAGNTLRADVLALTQAVAARQWSSADQALAQLRGDLTAAVAANGVSAERAQTIHADIASVAADLAAHRAAVTPSTPSSSTTHPKPPPKPPKHHDHGPGHDKGHGGGEGGD